LFLAPAALPRRFPVKALGKQYRYKQLLDTAIPPIATG